MLQIKTFCSGADCEAEEEFVVASLEEADVLVCECGYSVVAIAVAEFEPVHGKPRLRLITGGNAERGRSLAA